jgi:CubicO group peptidase (beta-lactamase class C family)
MKRSLGVALTLAGALALTALAHAAPAPTDDAKIAQVERGLMTPVIIAGQPPQKMTLQSRMQHYHIPSASIAFFDAKGIRWVRAYGATPSTLFQAGSISKPVSAAGIMRLVQDGRLNLDADINTVLTGWKLPQNALMPRQTVTLRELLSHTAGTTVHGYEGYERGKPVPTLQQVLDGEAPANSSAVRVDVQPGTEFRYSGGGYVIAQLLATQAVNEPFATYMQSSVLAPMGMTDSTFEQPLPEAWWNRVAPATDAAGKPYPGDWHVYPELTAAGLWSTPTDLAKFAIGVQRSLDGAPDAVLSKDTALEMLTPVKDGYGLGFQVTGSGPTLTFGHGGANAGFQSALFMHRAGEGIAIMTDSDNGNQFIGEVLASVGAAYGWSEYKPKEKALYTVPESFERFAGAYDLGEQLVSVERRGDELFLIDPAGEHRLYPESPLKFFMLDFDLDVTFAADASGAITGATFGDGGETGKRLPPLPPVVALDSSTLANYAGTYKLESSAMLITIEGNRIFAKLDDQQPFEIFASAKDQFFLTAVNAQLSFARDAAGTVTSVTLHQNGKELVFPKAP